MTVGVMVKLECLPGDLGALLQMANDAVAVYGAEFSAVREMQQSDQHPAVPVQFIHYDSELRPLIAGDDWFISCEAQDVEQIGAVLYVRGE